MKDKAQHAVVLDKATFDRIYKEVLTYKYISVSQLIERLKINGSLARIAIRQLAREGHIKKVVHHHAQLIYSASRFSFVFEKKRLMVLCDFVARATAAE